MAGTYSESIGYVRRANVQSRQNRQKTKEGLETNDLTRHIRTRHIHQEESQVREIHPTIRNEI